MNVHPLTLREGLEHALGWYPENPSETDARARWVLRQLRDEVDGKGRCRVCRRPVRRFAPRHSALIHPHCLNAFQQAVEKAP